MVRIGGSLHTGRTVHDLRKFRRARPDPILLYFAHEPVWLNLKVGWPVGHHTATHAPLLRREHERPPCLRRHPRHARRRSLEIAELSWRAVLAKFIAPQGTLSSSA